MVAFRTEFNCHVSSTYMFIQQNLNTYLARCWTEERSHVSELHVLLCDLLAFATSVHDTKTVSFPDTASILTSILVLMWKIRPLVSEVC
jgi:hypothetical protein